jgi:hypothetical protein
MIEFLRKLRNAILLGALGGGLAVLTASALIPEPWSIPTALGGHMVMLTEDGDRCFWFKDDQQLVCYHEIATWYGVDIVPTSVVQYKDGAAYYTKL